MSVQVLTITAKVRDNPVRFVSLADFETSLEATVAPSLLLNNPNITPYSLDHANRLAVFVETPPDIDLSQAPFYYHAQYEHAVRLFVAPYDLLYALTDPIETRGENLILIHSTGRCGSTLFSRALNRPATVVSLSEPDVYTLLVGLRKPDGSDDLEISRLIRTFTVLLCKPTVTKTRPTHWVIKFRSMVIELGHLLHEQFPQAKTVFIYRNTESWARSMARAFRMLDPEMADLMAFYKQIFVQYMPLIKRYVAPEESTDTQFLTAMWLSLMQRYLELHERGLPMCALRYEELKAAPEEMLAAVFAYCDLPVVGVKNLIAVFDEDSQQGTALSQEQARRNPYQLSEQDLTEISLLLQAQPVLNRPDIIVPNTIRHDP
jgi:hypothetical protein